MNGHDLLIISFDEHGGFTNHFPPPMNIPQPKDDITYNGVSNSSKLDAFYRLSQDYSYYASLDQV